MAVNLDKDCEASMVESLPRWEVVNTDPGLARIEREHVKNATVRIIIINETCVFHFASLKFLDSRRCCSCMLERTHHAVPP